jgi:N-formylglutamate deformylase
MSTPIWELQYGDGPLVASAIHDGSEVRAELLDWMAIGSTDRLREEDPFTGVWTSIAPTRIVGLRSRFEVDLNRPRENAVYLKPEDAWGLSVWREPPPDDCIARSLASYDSFYTHVRQMLEVLVQLHGRVVVFDLHTYNHRRQGPTGPLAAASENPEVNIGTGTMDRQLWAPIVDRFIGELRSADVNGRKLDVRENVKFRGGNFVRWIHQTFPETVCALAIEVKKVFMDEWTGDPVGDEVQAIERALQTAANGVKEELAFSEITGDHQREPQFTGGRSFNAASSQK